jgi:ribosomal protein L37AE/L43A
MSVSGRDAKVCERCGCREATTRYDEAIRKWLCRTCWQVLGPPAGTPAHPEDRPGWEMEVRRRLD